eukprot:5660882-Prymnesium_polylepis.1
MWPAASPHALQSALSSVQSATRWSSESQLRQPAAQPALWLVRLLRALLALFSAARKPTGS